MSSFNISNLSEAILHVDGDCFFASCEVAKCPELKGKPVITGQERGIVSSLTYEAKALGITRAMTLSQARKICPSVIMLPSDYESYSLYSIRMFEILKRITSDVEEYSIDECFANLTGLRRPLNMNYIQMAELIQKNLNTELGVSFSVGLAPTKTLAKIASKWKKPSGLTVIPGRNIHLFLRGLPLEDIWGVGKQTANYLKKSGLNSALDFANTSEDWVKTHLTKPHIETWRELRGELVYEVDSSKKETYKSISKTKTFTPASSCKKYVYSQLSKNVENACIKARRYKLSANSFFFFLKTNDFRYHGFKIKLDNPTNVPSDILNIIDNIFSQIFRSKFKYRATGITLLKLVSHKQYQLDIFGEAQKARKFSLVFNSLEEASRKYGKHTLFLASSLKAMQTDQSTNTRQVKTERKQNLFKGESARKRLSLPMLGFVK